MTILERFSPFFSTAVLIVAEVADPSQYRHVFVPFFLNPVYSEIDDRIFFRKTDCLLVVIV